MSLSHWLSHPQNSASVDARQRAEEPRALRSSRDSGSSYAGPPKFWDGIPFMRNFYTRKFPAAAPARPMDPPSLPHLSPPSSSRARPFPPLTHYLIHYLRSHAFRASNIRPRLRVPPPPPSTEECRRKQDANSDSDGSKSLRSLQLRYWSRELHPELVNLIGY